MNCHAYNDFFEKIANKTRLSIIETLSKKSMSVKEICNALDEEQSSISHNLKVLTDCHLLDVKRKGKKRIYSLNKDTIVPLMKIVKKHIMKYCGKDCIERKLR